MAVVYLSPSVQDFNVGYGTYGTEEQRMQLVADVVEAELIRNDVTVYRNDPDQTLIDLVIESNSLNPDAHVAIHSNASNGLARGAEIYYYLPDTNGSRLAEDIYSYLEPITPTEDLGIKEGASAFGGQGYYELRRTRAPAVIVEVGFHDNPADAQFIIDNTYEIGVAIARGILTFFGLPYAEDTAENINAARAQYNGRYF